MEESSAPGQGRSAAQRNIRYIQELQLKQREALQVARQQTEEKALLRERLSQVVLSRRTEDLKDTQRKSIRPSAATLVDRAAARKLKRLESEQDSSRVVELHGQAEQSRLEELAKWRAKQRLCPDTKCSRWHCDIDPHMYYPRCFELCDDFDMTAFSVEFKWTAAEAIVKRVLADGGFSALGVPDLETLKTAKSICQRRACFARNFVHEDYCDGSFTPLPRMTAEEWAVVENCPCFKNMHMGNASSGAVEALSPIMQHDLEQLLQTLRSVNKQLDIDGMGNVWIMKPAGKSRGRGILCLNSLKGIQDRIRRESSLDTSVKTWVVQKYIERPLVIRNRKFDIRLWVLVTEVSPLTIWLYKDCYLRFCAEDYSLEDIGNVYSHLSNNCIARQSEHFEAEDVASGNMWHCQEFASFLDSAQSQPDLWATHLWPQLQQIVLASLSCALDSLEERRSSHELFGYDFVIDESLKAWLIEVNSSPSLEHSTPVTSTLCGDMIDDLFKVVLDMPKDAPLPPFTAANAVPSLLHHRELPTQAVGKNSISDPPTSSNSSPRDDETIHSEYDSGSGPDTLEQQPDEEGPNQPTGSHNPDAEAAMAPAEAATDRAQAPDSPELTPPAFPNTAELPDIGYDTGRWELLHRGTRAQEVSSHQLLSSCPALLASGSSKHLQRLTHAPIWNQDTRLTSDDPGALNENGAARPLSTDPGIKAVQLPATPDAVSGCATQDADSAEIASSLLNLKASPSLVQAFLRSRSGT
ncbi:hypothetical protein WJX74_009214 [Apatococcus lobatus]|uniref:Uncharacterized protein n=1 Tax=Apatococcus lobatus TaxID=904363 RepID=A0AAW1SG48_9CHLO